MAVGSGEQFITQERWNVERPDVLVVACSDGRLQFSIDHFLSSRLGVHDYDRLFMPGGSGSLVPGGCEFIRADNYRRDLFFLLEKHGTEELILIAHGARPDGPEHATCGYYKKLMPNASAEEIHHQQILDVHEFLKSADSQLKKVRVRAFLAEVMADLRVEYTPIVGGLPELVGKGMSGTEAQPTGR